MDISRLAGPWRIYLVVLAVLFASRSVAQDRLEPNASYQLPQTADFWQPTSPPTPTFTRSNDENPQRAPARLMPNSSAAVEPLRKTFGNEPNANSYTNQDFDRNIQQAGYQEPLAGRLAAQTEQVASDTTLTDSNRLREAVIAIPPPSKTAQETTSKPRSVWQTVVTTVFALMIVVAAFALLVIGSRKAWSTNHQKLPNQVFEILGRSTYGPRQQVLVVRFGHKLLLVSNETGNMQTLSEIDSPIEVDRLIGLCEQQSSSSVSANFTSVLNSVMRGDSNNRLSKSRLFGKLRPRTL